MLVRNATNVAIGIEIHRGENLRGIPIDLTQKQLHFMAGGMGEDLPHRENRDDVLPFSLGFNFLQKKSI
jgi:hypothetical protein